MNYLTDEFITTKHQSPLQKIKTFFSENQEETLIFFASFLADLLVLLFLYYSLGLIF